jgi:hypothetical protein
MGFYQKQKIENRARQRDMGQAKKNKKTDEIRNNT